MDHGHGAIDNDAVKVTAPFIAPLQDLRHRPASCCSVLLEPTIDPVMQLSHRPAGFYADRLKRDAAAMASDSTSLAAVSVQVFDAEHDMRSLHSLQAPSFVPAVDIRSCTAASSWTGFLSSTEMAARISACTNTDVIKSMRGLADQDEAEQLRAKLQYMSRIMAASSSTGLPRGQMEGVAVDPNQYSSRKAMGPSTIHAQMAEFCKSGYLSMSDHLHVPSDSHASMENSDSPRSPSSPSKQESLLSTEIDLGCDLEKTQIQMSKRRKAQQKRVVYVPARDARHLKGETPPSDLWAWRKYGQKPIKGSPYPRGYYRCSSSKGCSARKQVERSWTDPTMLIVTYTSEHNHNLLAMRTNALSNVYVGPTWRPPSKDNCAEDQSEGAAVTSTCEVIDEGIFSSGFHGEDSVACTRDVDICLLTPGTSLTEEDGVFEGLEELPEFSTESLFKAQQQVKDEWFVP